MSDRARKVLDMPEASKRGGDPRKKLHTDVLPRDQLLEQARLEKRRADRSRAPLSLVVIQLVGEAPLDDHDLRDILTDLSLRKRETDLIGYLNDGWIAFLLPYTDAKSADAFKNLIVDRVDAPKVAMDSATYPDPRFDSLLADAGSAGEAVQVFTHRVSARKRMGLAIKRLIDIVGSLAMLVVCSPIMLVTAIAVKATSPGPIIFRQQRVGRGGVPFSFYKFRSMRTDVDDRVHREYVAKLIAGQNSEINQGDAAKPLYKMKADPRVTAVGRIIRKTSIDELPQLVNVLMGEMSLVGPRPPVVYEAEKYQSWHLRRLQEVRPGITGLWQVEGRSRTTFDDMVRLDLRYIRTWSLVLDLKILLKTIGVVLRTDGAD